MSEAKFTKKMEAGRPTDGAPFCIDGMCNIDGERFEVCSVWGVDSDVVSCEQSTANLNLFLSSPDMYEMLEFISENPSETDVVKIRKLLAKARGESC